MNFTKANRVSSVNSCWIRFNLVTHTHPMTIDWFSEYTLHVYHGLHFFDNSFFIPFNRLIWYSNHRIDEVQNQREETITTIRKCRAENYIMKTMRRSAHMSTYTRTHSQWCPGRKTKRNVWIGQHWIYVLRNPSCWLINELPPPSVWSGPYHCCYHSLVWAHTLPLLYEHGWKETKEKKVVASLLRGHTHTTAWNFLTPKKYIFVYNLRT